MTKTGNKRIFKPDAAQETLLRAVLRPPAETVTHWRKWQRMVALDDIDPASFRLLPLLHHKLGQAGVPEKQLARYRGVSRQAWYRNSMLLNRLGQLLEAFAQAGLRPPLLLKGGALVLEYYESPALRPMSDIDLLVRFADLEKIGTVMEENGWHSIHPRPESLAEARGKVMRECHYRNREGFEIDFHWNLAQENLYNEEYLEGFFQRAHPAEINGHPVLAPDAGDLLYHVIIHGLQAEAHPNLYWVIDAQRILARNGNRIDWGRIFMMALEDRLALRLKRASQRLSELGLQDLIPPAPRRLLTTLDCRTGEKIEFFFTCHPTTLLGNFPLGCFLAWRYARRFPSSRLRIKAIIDFFLWRWQLDHFYQLPGEFVNRFGQKLRLTLNT